MDDFIHVDVSLFHRKIAGILTGPEEELFEAWYAESESHRIYFERYKSQREKIACREMTKVDTMAALGCVKDKIADRRWVQLRWMLKWTGVAAVVVLGVLGYTFFRTISGPESSVATSVAGPGSSRIVLTLANGVNIFPDDMDSTTLITDGEVPIRIEKGIVYYPVAVALAGREPAYNELTVPAAGEYQLTLGDGTKVFLNSASRLKYPVEFTGGERTVFLEGEAYFKVSHGEEPFLVKTSKGVVKVFGTEFNVMAYSDEPEMQTTLITGSVGVSVRQGNFEKIGPGQQFVVQHATGVTGVRTVNVLPFVGWKDGLFVSQNDNLEMIMRKIARWYDVEVVYQHAALKEKRFFGIMKKQNSLKEVLQIIAETGDVKFTIKDHCVVVSE